MLVYIVLKMNEMIQIKKCILYILQPNENQ